MDPMVLAALISGGSQLLGGAVGGIGAGMGKRRSDIGRARQAAKLGDFAQALEGYDPSQAFSAFTTPMEFAPSKYRTQLGSLAGTRAGAADAQGMRELATSLRFGGGRATGENPIRAAVNRELAASMRGLGGPAMSGAQAALASQAQGQALAALAGQMGQMDMQQEQLRMQRLQGAAGLMGQAGGLEQALVGLQGSLLGQAGGLEMQERGHALQGRQQALSALQGQEALRMQQQQLLGQTYGHEAFASPRYNPQTGEIDEGK